MPILPQFKTHLNLKTVKGSHGIHFLWILWLLLFGLKFYYGFQVFGIVKTAQKTTQILGTLGILFLLFSFVWFLKPKLRFFYVLLLDLLLTLWTLLDFIFFRFYQDAITVRTLTTAWQLLSSKVNALTLFRPGDVLMILDFGILFLLTLAPAQTFGHAASTPHSDSNHPHLPRHLSAFRRLAWVILFGVIGFGLSYDSYQRLETDQPGITKTFYSKLYITQSVGNLEFHALDVWRLAHIQPDTPRYSNETWTTFLQWFRSTHPASISTSASSSITTANLTSLTTSGSLPKPNLPPDSSTRSTFGAAAGKNVIVIQVESLQEFVIGRSINGQEITPNLNRFLRQSFYFDHYYGETWNGGTSDAEFISNVSLYPVSQGSAFVDYPMNHYTGIASTLQAKGYSTVALEANLPGFWGMDLMAKSMGFQNVFNSDDFIQDEAIGMGLADRSMFQQSADRLQKMKEPFYSFLVTLSSHYPFELPERDKTINVAPYSDTLFGRYLQAVHYTDQAIGDFLDLLQRDGLLDRSVVVIYGDHPAPLPREDKAFQSFFGYSAQGFTDYQWLSLQKVPLIIHLPGSFKPEIIAKTAGQADLFPTLLGLMGEDASQYPVFGHDLLHSSAPGIAVSRSGALYYENRLYNIPARTVYDLNTGQIMPWSDHDPALQLYQDYFGYTDFVFRYDLQPKLAQALCPGSS